MPENCPIDGCFIGKCGCTSERHLRSDKTEKLIEESASAETLRKITPEEADAALKEGFYVTNSDGGRTGFGLDLKDHIERTADNQKQINDRKAALLFAMNAVRDTAPTERNHQGRHGRNRYSRLMDDGNAVIVVSDPDGTNIEKVFTVFPSRKEGKRLRKAQGRLAGWPAPVAALCLSCVPSNIEAKPTSRMSPRCAVEGDSRVRHAPAYRFAGPHDTTFSV